MKLLLRRDIANVGLAGEVVEVKEGYARNYLIPHHLGVLPTSANMKAIEEDKKLAEQERRLRRQSLERQAEKLHNVELTIASACNPEGKLYGSVGPREIAAALRDEGHDVETKQVHLREPIRHIDNVVVPVVFADDLKVEVKVWIVRESGSGELEEEQSTEQAQNFDHQDRRGGRSHEFRSDIDAIETDL